jgi:hypothetical protein
MDNFPIDNFLITNMTAVFRLWDAKRGAPFPGWYRHLAVKGINTEYNPRRFHAIIQRVRVAGSSSASPPTQGQRIIFVFFALYIIQLIKQSFC